MKQAPYDDGRWTVGDHSADTSGTLWCRGNVGEVFPNVVTPLSASLYRGAMDRASRRRGRVGMLTDKQVAGFRPDADGSPACSADICTAT
jgi:hypothetical protein